MKRIVIFISTFTIVLFCFNTGIFTQRHISGQPTKYALLIGGGATKHDTDESYYKNIEYVANVLKKLNYKDNNVKILFYGGKSPIRPIVEGDATKDSVMNELSNLEKEIDTNDTFLLFRSGHGMIELIFERYGILSKNDSVPENENVVVVGTAAVMCFPDGPLSYLELLDRLGSIKAKQNIVILNQCYSGQFTEIASSLENTVVITETAEVEIAFKNIRKTDSWSYHVWPFVKCLFDGFLKIGPRGKKQSILKAFQYMLQCNPNVEGLPVEADRPLLRESPQIRYGKGLQKGAVYIN